MERCKGANRWGEFRYLEMVGTIVGFLEILNGKKGSAFFPGKIFPGIPFKLIAVARERMDLWDSFFPPFFRIP